MTLWFAPWVRPFQFGAHVPCVQLRIVFPNDISLFENLVNSQVVLKIILLRKKTIAHIKRQDCGLWMEFLRGQDGLDSKAENRVKRYLLNGSWSSVTLKHYNAGISKLMVSALKSRISQDWILPIDPEVLCEFVAWAGPPLPDEQAPQGSAPIKSTMVQQHQASLLDPLGAVCQPILTTGATEDDSLFLYPSADKHITLTKSRCQDIFSDVWREFEGIRLTGHSVRVGSASLSWNLGHPLEEIVAVGRWRSKAYSL